jgi:hypothetical protein
VEVYAVSDNTLPVRIEIQKLLDQYALLFVAPFGLPPRCRYDHAIPLIEGAQPVFVCPYRFAPELKIEIEGC